MKKKGISYYFIFLVLAYLLTESITFMQMLFEGTFFGGSGGVPLKYSNSAAMIFSSGSINYTNLLVDVIFWFGVILLVKKLWSLRKK